MSADPVVRQVAELRARVEALEAFVAKLPPSVHEQVAAAERTLAVTGPINERLGRLPDGSLPGDAGRPRNPNRLPPSEV